METVLKAIADWIKGILTAGIMSNLSGLFDDVNTQVGNIAQQVGTKPSSFEPRVFAMIEPTAPSLRKASVSRTSEMVSMMFAPSIPRCCGSSLPRAIMV